MRLRGWRRIRRPLCHRAGVRSTRRPPRPVPPRSAAVLGTVGAIMWEYIYILLTIAMGIAAIFRGGMYPGIAGLVGPTLCRFAGSGLKGSLLVGTGSQKLGGLATAIVFLIIGFGVVYHSGY